VEVPAAKADPERDRYLRVQAALNQIGYGPVPASGSEDPETTNAIRRFELDNGLPITGRPGKRVIDRLISIGALQPA
jgi:peptidoglycan hydrolase-like protein with peptidoglycan-binding domain